MTKTQRSYTDKETGVVYRLHTDQADRFHLIVDKAQGPNAPCIGTEVNGFYLCAFDSVVAKLNTGKQISLSYGEFYNLKEGEQVTHRKFAGFNKFSKL